VPRDAIAVESFAQPIVSAVFESGRKRANVTIHEADALRIIPRAAFDAVLLEHAVANGALHVAARAHAIDHAGSDWIVQTPQGSLIGAWLLGADGPSGIFRKKVFRPFTRAQLSIAAGAFVDGISVPEIVIGFVERPAGYLWSFPRRDHLAVGACTQATEASTAALHALTDRWLDTYQPAAGRPRRRYAWPIPSLAARDLDEEQPAGHSWMLLGDAAGLVDPITREGIFFALQSGVFAAQALTTSDPARTYGASVRDAIHPELKRAARLRATFFTPSFTSLLIDALNRSQRIRQIMIDLIAGRQDYAGLKRRLLRTFEIPLMIEMLTGRYRVR
jgi:flavin-dependent dehydrogenase